MKLDPKAVDEAIDAFYDCDCDPESQDDMIAALRAYLKATNSVIVPRAKRDSAVALLMGLSLYWHEQGDVSQSRHVESVAKALTQDGE